MAITELTEAGYDPLFKINYLKLADNLYNSSDNFGAQTKKTFGTIGGKNSRHPIETTFGGGVGSSKDGTLPEPRSSEFLEPVYNAKRSYARIKIDGLTIASSEKTEHAFIKAIDQETTGKLVSFNRWASAQRFNDGTGALGQFSGNASGLATDPVVTILTTGRYRRRPAFFERGDYVNVNTLADVFEIISYAPSTGALTLKRISGSSDLTSIGGGTHTIYMQNSKDADPYGLLGIASDGTFYGVTSGYRYQPHTLSFDPAGAPLDTEMLVEVVENMDSEDVCPTTIVMSPYQYQRYLSLLESKKVFPVETSVKIKKNAMTSDKLVATVAFGGIKYAGPKSGISIIKNRFVRPDMVWFVRPGEIEEMHVKKPGWKSGPDQRIFDRMPDQDAFEARYVCYKEIKINPWRVGYIENLAIA